MQEATVRIVDYTSEEEVNIPMPFPSGFSANVSECMHICIGFEKRAHLEQNIDYSLSYYTLKYSS